MDWSENKNNDTVLWKSFKCDPNQNIAVKILVSADRNYFAFAENQ